MRRELRRVLAMLTKRLAPPSRSGVLMVLPDDGSGDDLDPRVRGDGDPDYGVHTILDSGRCRQCSETHVSDPAPDRPTRLPQESETINESNSNPTAVTPDDAPTDS